MSAIFGCVYLDGRPLPPDTEAVLSRAMAGWGPDGVSTRSGKSAVFGTALLAVTPESVHESLPSAEQETGVLFAAAARFDNRDELCDIFGIPAAERPSVPDGRLARDAFRKWGENVSEHLFGDWCLAAWDGRDRRLILAKDRLGNTGVYYFYHPPVFAFAPAPEALFGLEGVERRLSESYLASYLSFVTLGEEGDTCWTDVKMLPAGHLLTVTPEGKSLRRYWTLTPPPAAARLKDDEYVEGFLHHYRAAVKTRLRSRRPIGSTLSSGLDSGSVTALAAQSLKESGAGLIALTSVPLFPAERLFPNARTDEWPLAHAVAVRFDNIDHVAIDAADITPLAGIERAVALHHSPQHAAVNEFWIMALFDAARRRGLGVLLTGQMGNGGVSWTGGSDRVFGLFADGRWDEGIRAMRRWKERHGRSWIRTLAEHLGKPLLRPLWTAANPPDRNVSAIHPAFAARMELAKAAKAARRSKALPRRMNSFEERRLTLIVNGMQAGPIWHGTGSAFGLEVRDPTADIRLVEYCLSVPEDQDTYGGGQRMLMRRAMEGLLPPEVQWNGLRGKQAADAAFRLVRHAGEMEATLARLEAHPLARQYVDWAALRRTWRDVQKEVSARTSRPATIKLMRGIMGGCFVEDASRRGDV